MEDYILELREISKAYPGVQALDKVSLALKKGEVHALAGENGAGKSTLIKCISGAIKPDSGTLYVNGEEFLSLSPQNTIEHGIVTVYQELNLIPALSVAENVFVGTKPEGQRLYSRRKAEAECKKILDGYGIAIKPSATVKELSAAQRQLVEIVRAVSRNVKLLILDEPTSSLTVHETEFLFETIEKLRRQGVTIVYISHVLEETFRIADRVSVMRDGKMIDTVDIADLTREKLVSMMVGHEMSENFPKRKAHGEDVVLRVDNLTGNGVRNISFELHKGEILGFAGLVGAGRSELMHAIYGSAPKTAGEIYVDGTAVKIKTPYDAIKNGFGMIPEDRKLQGVFLRMNVKQNVVSTNLKQLCRFGVMNEAAEKQQTLDFIEKLRIKTPNITQTVNNLSGGNQQKIAVSKALAPLPGILIFDEPTRGIDVGAKQEIYRLMNELVEQGHSIIMVSSEMIELMGMADRIIVLCEGQIAGELSKNDYSQERILSLASGNNGGITSESSETL